MKELTIFVAGLLVATLVDFKYDLSQTEQTKTSFEHPYIQWSDTTNRPPKGFEKVVDIYYNDTRDTIFMELSYGPE